MWPNLQFPAVWSHLLKKFLMENLVFCAVRQSYKMTKHTQKSLDIFECVWPFCGVGAQKVNLFYFNVPLYFSVFQNSSAVPALESLAELFIQNVWPGLTDWVMFTEEILNGKIHSLSSALIRNGFRSVNMKLDSTTKEYKGSRIPNKTSSKIKKCHQNIISS